MQPEQPQQGHNPYDFIMNPEQPVKHPLGGIIPQFSGGLFGKRLAVLIGGATVVLILIAIIGAVFFSGKGVTPQLINMAAAQTELVHIANFGSGMVTQPDNKTIAIDVQLTIQTQQNELLAYLAGFGTKVTAKQLALDSNAQLDAQLTAAQSNSTVDMVFDQIMEQRLQSYTNTLKQIYALTSNTKTKQLLSTDYTQTQLLLKQVPSATGTP